MKNDLFISLLIVSFFVIFSVFLPIYDNINGFHNLIFGKYELTWYDGKSPANFYIIKNILEGKSIFFPKGYLIGNIQVENCVDFFEKDGSFFPIFNSLSNYIYAVFLSIVYPSSDLLLFKAMILLTIIFSGLTLSFFYLVQRLLGLDIKYSFLSTFITGVATSILIYSRYLFIDHTMMGLMFLSLIYILLKNQKERSFKVEVFAMIIFSLFTVFLWYEFLVLIFFVVLSYIFIKYKLIHSAKILIIPILIIGLTLIPFYLPYFGVNYRMPPPGIKDMIKIFNVPIFRVFSKYINALDYSVFGYHNQTSIWKLYRGFAHIYAFEEPKGNAIFMASYGLFGSLFGPRGIIFNSPYLIFSILGIFVYKRNKERNLLLTITILIILCYGLFYLRWQGGFSPRYIRYYTIPVLFLTFFSFYYIQETKNILGKIVFLILVILSVLNVTSLAIRADWTYEHEADLFSYDLVLWPWIQPQYLYLNWYQPETINNVEHRHMPEEAKIIFYSNLTETDFSISVKSFYKERTLDIIFNDKLIGTYKIPTNVTKITKKVDIQHGKNIIIFKSREGCDVPVQLGINPDLRCISFTFYEINFKGFE
jgi:hypothetical protein